MTVIRVIELCQILAVGVFVQSWLLPGHPALERLRRVGGPWWRRTHRGLGLRVGGVDFSPLLWVFALEVTRRTCLQWMAPS